MEQYLFVPLIRRLKLCTNLQFNHIEIHDEQKKNSEKPFRSKTKSFRRLDFSRRNSFYFFSYT